MTPSSIVRGRFTIVVAAVASALVLSGCGSSSSSSSSAAGGAGTVSGSGNRQQARVALAECLRGQGLDVPDPTTGGGGGGGGGGGIFRSLRSVPTVKLTAARQACKSQFAAAFPALNLSPTQRAQLQQQLVKFASCVRSHGINFPDPQLGTGGGPGFGRAFGGVDRNSPAFASAAQACRSLRPRFGRGGPGGAGGGPGA